MPFSCLLLKKLVESNRNLSNRWSSFSISDLECKFILRFLLFRQKQMQNDFAETSQIRPIRGIAMLLPIFWCPSCKPPNAYPLYVLPLSDKLFRTSWPWRFSIFLQPLLPTNNILGCFAPIQNKKPWRRRHSPGYPDKQHASFIQDLSGINGCRSVRCFNDDWRLNVMCVFGCDLIGDRGRH